MHTSPYIYEIPGNLNVPTLEEDAKRDLLTRPRSIPPKYFYDATGSDLFEKICRTPEYYPTRRENEILRQYGPTIIERVQPTNILEIGSGSSAKTERILDACMQIRQRPCYSAFDISSKALLEAKTRLDKKYSWLDTSLLLGDYEAGFAHVPRVNGANLVLFLGSTIGNLNPRSAVSMLNELYNYMSSQDYLLLGYDRVKDGEILDAAYNDDQGLTAEFNLNILNVLNDRLGADFVLDRFEHSASYDTLQQQVEVGPPNNSSMSVQFLRMLILRSI